MPQALCTLPLLLALTGYALAGLSIWPSLHIALSNASIFVDFTSNSSNSTIVQRTLSLVNTETNTTLTARKIPNIPTTFRVEFNCSCFLYAGTFRFLLRQTSIGLGASHNNGTNHDGVESTTWWWSSELQVQWPTFHVAVERAGNHSGSFQVGIATNEHFTACSRGIDSALFLEVGFMEYNQIGRNSIDKVRARTRYPIKPLRSQSIELPCAFPFTEKDFIRVALKSPHSTQDVKSSGPLYLSRIFSYKLLVENGNAYRSACEGTMSVKLLTPPCAHVNGKVLLYKDTGVSPSLSTSGTGSITLLGFGTEEPASPPLAYNWLTQGENETEFNCSVFYPGRNKYCFRFVFNYSRSPSPAQTCLVVHRSAESWGPWQPWSLCSVTCGEGVRERIRNCLLPSGGGGLKCTGMVKEQSLCSLEDCVVSPVSTPSLPPVHTGTSPLGNNIVAVVGISLCLAVILATVIVTVWRKLCQTPPSCSSVRRGSLHSPGGRKLSDEASICANSLQRPSVTDGHITTTGVTASQKDLAPITPPPLTQTLVIPIAQDPERLSPSGQKMLPPIFGYRLAQQQLKEMKKKGLKEATQLYHVSSSPVHDTLLETSTSPTCSPIPSPTAFPLGPPKETNSSPFRIAAPFSDMPVQTLRTTPDRLSPRVELVLGPPVSGHSKSGSTGWRDRTADWVEMVERSGLAGLKQGTAPGNENNYEYRNPYFRRTCSFNDTKPQLSSAALARQFRERSMTQVGSRTLPEGSSWKRSGKLPPSYPFTEESASEWAKARLQRKNLRKTWSDTQNNEVKHTGTNTDNLISTSERLLKPDPVEKEVPRTQGISGIGGPVAGQDHPIGMNHLSLNRAELNWSRRGPSPIQRNMLARKLKEAQSSSCARGGRQRSSTFSVSSSQQRKNRCRSLPMSGDFSGSSGGSPYRLSEAEQKMMDLDLSSPCEEGDE
ncbi:thrombospondin type-1 domain-containing protein 1 [Boleophthalmus pectinirostris]|uniref:thrombospondin type-1 domain-containing protein 1 n=1 Tax=Boleophthalmus pectinirostris TaxID=150288 RepID=UPI000A1C4B95|nr:thrombospondin type-1 domain-containing protein 1 [Boleophthalmus pectinirostris]